MEGENEEIDNMINDKTNDLYAVSYSSATMISPFIGSYLEQIFDINHLNELSSTEKTCDLVGFMIFCFGVILFFGNCGLNVF